MICYYDCFLIRRDASPIIPSAKIASVDGSGTAAVAGEFAGTTVNPSIEKEYVCTPSFGVEATPDIASVVDKWLIPTANV